jgi:hypothetical protein
MEFTCRRTTRDRLEARAGLRGGGLMAFWNDKQKYAPLKQKPLKQK